MDKLTAKQLDEILMFLNNSNSFYNWVNLLEHLTIDQKDGNKLFSILSSKDYIKHTAFIGGAKTVEISDSGRAFVHTSSFSRERIADKRKELKSNTALTIDIISKILSISGVVVSIYLGYLNYDKGLTIKQLEKEKLTLKTKIDSLQIKNIKK